MNRCITVKVSESETYLRKMYTERTVLLKYLKI